MIGCSDVPGGQTLVHHLQQRRVLQSSCDSFFVCQLFVHCTDTRREINYITHSQRTSSRLWLDVFCYLLPLRHESQEWCGHRSEWETEKHTKFRQQNINILYDALYMVTNSQRREMLKVHPSNHLTHTHTHTHTLIDICTLNLSGRERSSLTLIDRPMSVAMLQWGIVGVNSTPTVLSASLTWEKRQTGR